MNLDDALAAGFEARWVNPDLKLGDTVEMKKLIIDSRNFQQERVWITLQTQAEVDLYKEKFAELADKARIL